MIGKIIGAIAGAQASKYSRNIGGTGGALLGVVAVPVIRRMKWSSLAALAAGGYLVKKLNDRAGPTKAPPGPV